MTTADARRFSGLKLVGAIAVLLTIVPVGAAGIGTGFELFGSVTLTPASGSPMPFDTLVEINPQTAAQTQVGATGAAIGIAQMDADPLTGRFVGSDFFRQPDVIYQIDPTTGVASTAATLPVPINALAFAPDGGLFGVQPKIGGASILGRVDLQNQSFSPVMTLESGAFVPSIDFAPSGLLYAIYTIAGPQQFLVEIDIASQVEIGRSALGSFNVSDMDYAADGQIYHSNSSAALFRIDPLNPVQVQVGFGLLGAGGGLASIVPLPAASVVFLPALGVLGAVARRRRGLACPSKTIGG